MSASDPIAELLPTIEGCPDRRIRPSDGMERRSVLPSTADVSITARLVSFLPIVLQNSKVAAVNVLGENLKRKEVDDSHSFSRATEVAHEFGARRGGPSDHYTKSAPAALRIFDTSCKTTFATQSANKRNRTDRLTCRDLRQLVGDDHASEYASTVSRQPTSHL